MIQQVWAKLTARDRHTLTAGGTITALLLGWGLLWEPLVQRRAELIKRIEQQQHGMAEIYVAVTEIERLRNAGVRSRAERQGKSLLALTDATARGAGLGEALKRVEPTGTRNVRVSFETVSFDTLIHWLEDLSRDFGVQATNLSADRIEGIGLVNAHVTLEEAP